MLYPNGREITLLVGYDAGHNRVLSSVKKPMRERLVGRDAVSLLKKIMIRGYIAHDDIAEYNRIMEAIETGVYNEKSA